MGGIIISLFTFVLLVICGLMTVIILMQKPSANAGMGAALGGGAAESVFGGETANVLLKYTVRIAVVFFVLSFLLYIGNLVNHRFATAAPSEQLPNFGGAKPAASAASAGTATPSATTAATGDKLLNDAPAKATTTATAPAAPATSATPAATAASASGK